MKTKTIKLKVHQRANIPKVRLDCLYYVKR